MGLKINSILKAKLGEKNSMVFLENLEYSKKLYEAIRHTLKAGMTEIDVKKVMDDAMTLEDGTRIDFNYICAAGKNATKPGITHETNYVIKPGDVLRIDLWFGHNGFWVDTSRNFFVSDVSKETEKMWLTTIDVLTLLERTVRPCMLASDVYNMMENAYLQAGYKGYELSGHAGHPMGENYSLVQPDCQKNIYEPLPADVAFALEPGIVSQNVCLRLEDNYILTENGLINVFNYPRDINYFIVD